jgi:hypothetical protein
MGLQGITQHGKFARRGFDKAAEEVINPSGFDGEWGKAGMKMFPLVGALYRTHKPRISPAAVARELLDDGGNVWRAYLLEGVHQSRSA